MKDVALILLLVCLPSASLPASDFATEVVEYYRGGAVPPDQYTGIAFDNPYAALGPPTVDTTDDPQEGWPSEIWPVNPVYQPFRAFEETLTPEAAELVSLGKDGYIILKFDHDVQDDELNPCGVDFIIFGNANLRLAGGEWWNNGMDPREHMIDTRVGVRAELGIVSVSLTGAPGTWQTFNDPNNNLRLKADSWAPTLGRVLRPPVPPATSWWAEPTDPTLPFNPSMPTNGLAGLSLAEACRKYGHSAGGTGFDLALVGLPAIRYVRIQQSGSLDITPEIDAISDVRPLRFPDFDCDTDVDAADLQQWLQCATGPGIGPPAPGCKRADLDADGDIDSVDFAILQRCYSGENVMAEFDCLAN